MKAILITGASSGLGKAAAKLFALKDWIFIATMRNPENETELFYNSQCVFIAVGYWD